MHSGVVDCERRTGIRAEGVAKIVAVVLVVVAIGLGTAAAVSNEIVGG